MAIDPDLAKALRAVQEVTGSPAFIDMVADGEALHASVRNAGETLRAHGIAVPEAIQRVEARARHTPPAARKRGLRGGNVEWRFYVQIGAGSWRVVYLCDAWPLDEPDGTIKATGDEPEA